MGTSTMDMSKTFPAGKYYIGDPCYVISKWDSIIKSTGCFGLDVNDEVKNWFDGCFKYNGRKCYADGTAYGDGEYRDNLGRRYLVDAGLIGIVPFESVDKNKKCSGGQIIEFENEFNVSSLNGFFRFGHITINTRDEDDDNEMEDWE